MKKYFLFLFFILCLSGCELFNITNSDQFYMYYNRENADLEELKINYISYTPIPDVPIVFTTN